VTRGRIDIAGLGIRPTHQITTEVDSCVRSADVVFHSVGSETTRRWLEGKARESYDLNSLYKDGGSRLPTYQATAELVLRQARDGKRVALVVYGHPCLLHTGVQLTLRAARREGIPIRVMPGLSTVDGLLASLGVDPGFGGLQVLEANDMLKHGRTPQVDGHVVVLQVACVGPRVHRASGHSGEHTDLLIERLRSLYRDDDAALHFRLATDGRPDDLSWTTVGALTAERWSNRSSLYLPPAKKPPVDPAWSARFP
jgi:precorrin-2 methylase